MSISLFPALASGPGRCPIRCRPRLSIDRPDRRPVELARQLPSPERATLCKICVTGTCRSVVPVSRSDSPPPIHLLCHLSPVYVFLFSVLAADAAAQPLPEAGQIKVVSGEAFVVRKGSQLEATVGLAVFEADTLRTGADGRLGVTLKDDTRLALGPSSEARLDRFLYAPDDGRFGFAMQVLRGIAAYVSGRIAKLAPDAVRLETPAAIVGVRGTDLAIRVQEE